MGFGLFLGFKEGWVGVGVCMQGYEGSSGIPQRPGEKSFETNVLLLFYCVVKMRNCSVC